MTPADLIRDLTERGATLTPRGDRIVVDAPQGVVTPEIRARLAELKPELLRLLSRTDDALDAGSKAPPDSGGAGSKTPRIAGENRILIPHPVNAVPRELSYRNRIATGIVNRGWTPGGWAARLRQLAERCEGMHPDRAAELRAWAGAVERRYGLGGGA